MSGGADAADPAARHARVKELVFLASRLSGAERSALVEREANGDDALRREVLSILESAIPTGNLLGPMDETVGGARARPGSSVAMPKQVGAYRLGRELGRGGMGIVFEAVDERTGEGVAVKILHPGLVTGEAAVDRFAREARVGASITHGGVVRTLDAGTDVVAGQELHWLVMERVEGRTLRGLLADLGTVPEGLLREIARQCAAALAAIHAAGVVHRDLKPENVLITDDQRIRIMDLGVAKTAAGSVSLTREGQFLGSVSHAAPEQFEGREVGPAADLYALGVVLHELGTGSNPFVRESVGGTIRAHLESVPPPMPGVSPFLAAVVSSLLEKQPDRRIAGSDQLHGILAEGEASAWWRERMARRAAAAPRIAVARSVAMIGRRVEMEALSAAWRAATAGGGAAVLLVGEAGIGKTRLLAELADLALQDDALVLHSLLSRTDGACPFGSSIFDVLGGSAAEDARGRLARWPALASAVSALAGGDLPPADVTPELLGIGLARWLQSVASDRPVAWFLDDAHLAPPEVASIARAIANASASRRVLVVVSGRADGEAAWLPALAAVPGMQRIELERLQRRDVEKLVEVALESPEIALRLGPALALRSDGVPAFALALLRSLQDGGALHRDAGGGWRLKDGAENVGLPKAARDAALARLAGIPRDARDVLDAAAVQGLLFDAELLAEQLDRPLVRVLQDLAELERRHELVRSEGRLHALDGRVLLEVLEDEMHGMLRAAHHSSLAQALVRRLPPGRPVDGRAAAEIAAHALRGRRPEDAVPYLGQALDHLTARNLHGETVELTGLALALGERLPPSERTVALLRRSHSLGIMGRRDEERVVADRALQSAEELGDPALLADALLAKGLHHFVLIETHDAIGWLQRAAELARSSGDVRTELRASRNLATALGRARRRDEAVELHRWCRRRAQEVGDALTEAMSVVNLAALQVSSGEYREAHESYAEGVELARVAGDARIEAHAEGGLAITLVHLGRREEAVPHALRQVELSREVGDRRSESLGLGTAGLAAIERGRLGEATSLISRAVELARAIRDPRGQSITIGNLSMIRFWLGDFDEARRLLDEAILLARSVSQAAVEASHLLREAQFEEAEARPEAMLETARRAEPMLLQAGNTEGAAHALMLQGEALRSLGRPDEAASRWDAALALVATHESPAIRTMASLLRAQLPGGDPEAAIAAFLREEPRLGVADRISGRHSAWKLTGDASHLARAHELVETLKSHAPAAWRDALVQRHPLRAEIVREWAARRA